MKVLILIFITVVFLVSAIGFYRTWFTISRAAPAAGSSVVSITVAADTAKIKQDVEAIKSEATGLTGQTKEGTKSDGQASENATSNAQ
jgi:hypothetical protein